jgi:hypothetical protein
VASDAGSRSAPPSNFMNIKEKLQKLIELYEQDIELHKVETFKNTLILSIGWV